MYRRKGGCQPNRSCCRDEDLECTRKFNPPLLSSATEFCAEVLAKGLPVPDCALAQPKKLVIEKEAPPLAKLATSRHIKNWQRWCYIWRQTYNSITAKRNLECRPPVMSGGEAHLFKNEDKELFDRTLHQFRIKGVYVKNVDFPDPLRPKPGTNDDAEITEVITDRHRRDFKEMKKHRYPNHIRNEVSIPPRLPHKPPVIHTPGLGYVVESKEEDPETDRKTLTDINHSSKTKGFNYEAAWANTKFIQMKKDWLSCSFKLYGKIDPFAENLILQPDEVSKEDPEIAHAKDKINKKSFHVPQLVFTTEDEGDEVGSVISSVMTNRKSMYADFHGPILKISSQFANYSMAFSRIISEASHLIQVPEPLTEKYLFDENHHFSVTTKCKDMKTMELKNEGTTAIRCQWFRNPPNKDEIKMLEDLTYHKSLRINPDGDHLYQIAAGDEANPNGLQSKLQKKANLEFHFSELPSIILPGQSTEFRIIFRSKTPGYFEQTIYLLTHPRISTADGKQYAVRLSGICTNVELSPVGEPSEFDSLKNFLDEKSLEEECGNLMDSILDRSVWDADHLVSNEPIEPQALGTRRVTAESTFCPHNKHLHYHSETSERAVDIARQLIEILVPKERVENTQTCTASIQGLYNLIMTARSETDLHWSELRNDNVEELLEELHDCLDIITEQRLFSWPEIEGQKTFMYMKHIAYESVFSHLT